MKRDRSLEKNFIRRESHRPPKDTFLIYCQGENTEIEYFNSFRLVSAHVKPIHKKGGDSLSFIKNAIKDKEKSRDTFDQYWLVFDKDDTVDLKFNESITLGKSKGFNIAYSIQAFEFWFLLHFENYSGKIWRKTYSLKLNSFLSKKYSKEKGYIKSIFKELEPKMNIAIERAKSIYQSFEPHENPASEESSTTVFILVEELIKFK